MAPLPDVIVIGGGAIGASCARELGLAGARVTLIDRSGAAGEAWRASAGMLAAQVESNPGDATLELALAGREYFAERGAALQRTTGIDLGMTQTGILEVVHSEADVEALKERVAWQRQQALRAGWLDPQEVAEGWPWLAPVLGAFWSPEDGSVDPTRLVAACVADATRLGAKVVSDTVVGLDINAQGLHGVIGERGRYSAGTVVIAAGAWSGRLESLPRPLSVEPVRGQMISFTWPEAAPPAIVYGAGCYMLHRGGEMLVGATVEHAGFAATVTDAGRTELHQRASTNCPALATMSPTRGWAGLRPGTPDGLPIIGAEPRLRGLWYATGHGRNGILMSGITGQLIARAISGADVGDALAPFRPERFWDS